MPLDAICLRAVLSELNGRIAGGRIEKVYQPDREEIVLQIRGGQGACRLLLSASASAPRIHLIEQNRENPATPPMFCMLLRKHIQGAKIVSLTSRRSNAWRFWNWIRPMKWEYQSNAMWLLS